jgi:gluconolactonase
MKFNKLLIFLPFLCLCTVYGQDKKTVSPILAPGAQLEKVADGFSFTEGPSVDTKGNVYFTDQPNDQILIWSTDDKLSVFLKPSFRSNGTAFDKEGNLWACADEKNQLIKISPDKNISVVIDNYDGKLLNGPNDIWFDKKGGIYMSDPFWKRDYWTRGGMEQDIMAVYYISPDHKTMTRVISDFKSPNGIVGSADGKTLYVADINGRKTWKYSVNSDGSLSNKTLFCDMGSDGVTMDSKENIYITGNNTVTIFDKSGKKIETIKIPERSANVCFGGKDLKYLYITAGKSLYRIKLKVKGTRN